MRASDFFRGTNRERGRPKRGKYRLKKETEEGDRVSQSSLKKKEVGESTKTDLS